MTGQRKIIWNGLQELSNAVASGRQCWVTFSANANEHWLQCTPTLIRMDWPFTAAPAENESLKRDFGSGRELQIDTWEADSYVTFRPNLTDVHALVAAIDSAFRDLYGLGAGYVLTYTLEGG